MTDRQKEIDTKLRELHKLHVSIDVLLQEESEENDPKSVEELIDSVLEYDCPDLADYVKEAIYL